MSSTYIFNAPVNAGVIGEKNKGTVSVSQYHEISHSDYNQLLTMIQRFVESDAEVKGLSEEAKDAIQEAVEEAKNEEVPSKGLGMVVERLLGIGANLVTIGAPILAFAQRQGITEAALVALKQMFNLS